MSDVTLGTLYSMNQQLMNQVPEPTEDMLENDFANIGAWFSSMFENKYFMLLCKELSDYTVIHINNYNWDSAITELREILESRGKIISLDYVHGENGYQCWIKTIKQDIPEFHMFYLFPYDWGVVEVW